MLRPEKKCSYLETYSSVSYFSFGATIVGKAIDLSWNLLPSAQFNSLDAVYQADTVVAWDPSIPGSTVRYNVNVMSLNGEYFISQESTSQESYRQNISMQLLIMSQVT
jgi:hypothetical protein